MHMYTHRGVGFQCVPLHHLAGTRRAGHCLEGECEQKGEGARGTRRKGGRGEERQRV